MRSKIIISIVSVAFSSANLFAAGKPIVQKIPKDWYKSTTKLFEYCVNDEFHNPICPQIQMHSQSSAPAAMTTPVLPTNKVPSVTNSNAQVLPVPKLEQLSNSTTDSTAVAPKRAPEASTGLNMFPPEGPLTSETLFKANYQYLMGRPPVFWLTGLKLSDKRPKNIDPRLWQEAQWLWAKILFDQRKFQESSILFDQLTDAFKGRALFHQQRAWVLFFTGKFDRALGSIVSAESPLVYPVPYFEKYFLRGLIERETCRWDDAFKTIAAGRAFLHSAHPDAETHPWVVLCNRWQLGGVCKDLKAWYEDYYAAQVKRGLSDLDLLEIELKDRGASKQGKRSTSPIVWPYIGENWADEVGYYSVPIQSECS